MSVFIIHILSLCSLTITFSSRAELFYTGDFLWLTFIFCETFSKIRYFVSRSASTALFLGITWHFIMHTKPIK